MCINNKVEIAKADGTKETYNAKGSWLYANSGSKNNISATLYWEKGSVTVNNIIGHENNNYKGFLVVFTNETPNRTKVYLDVINNGKPQMKNGQEILGVFEYLFK